MINFQGLTYRINIEKIGGEALSFGDCSDDWEWATAFCNLPGTLFSPIADDDCDYDFNDDDDDCDKFFFDDFCNPPWHTLLPDC